MTGEEHFTKAEQYAALAVQDRWPTIEAIPSKERRQLWVTMAITHATLAQARFTKDATNILGRQF